MSTISNIVIERSKLSLLIKSKEKKKRNCKAQLKEARITLDSSNEHRRVHHLELFIKKWCALLSLWNFCLRQKIRRQTILTMMNIIKLIIQLSIKISFELFRKYIFSRLFYLSWLTKCKYFYFSPSAISIFSSKFRSSKNHGFNRK